MLRIDFHPFLFKFLDWLTNSLSNHFDRLSLKLKLNYLNLFFHSVFVYLVFFLFAAYSLNQCGCSKWQLLHTCRFRLLPRCRCSVINCHFVRTYSARTNWKSVHFFFFFFIEKAIIYHVEEHPVSVGFYQCIGFNKLSPTGEKYYNLYTICGMYVVPFLVISYIYVRIVVVLTMEKRNRKWFST